MTGYEIGLWLQDIRNSLLVHRNDRDRDRPRPGRNQFRAVLQKSTRGVVAMRLLLLFAVLLLPVLAMAADWKLLGMSMDKDFVTYHVDKASIFHQNDGHHRL